MYDRLITFLENDNINNNRSKSEVVNYYEIMKNTIDNDPEIERKIQTQMGTIINTIYQQSMNTDQGYCMKFMLPLMQVNELFKTVGLDPGDLELAFRKDWMYPKGTKMYSD